MEEIFTWELMQKRYFDPTFGGALVEGQRNVVAAAADVTGYAFLVGPRSTSPIVSLCASIPLPAWAFMAGRLRSPAARHTDSTFSMGYRLR